MAKPKSPKFICREPTRASKNAFPFNSISSIPVDSWLSRGESLPSNQFLREKPSKPLLLPFFRFLSPSRHCLTCTVKCLFLNLTIPTESVRARSSFPGMACWDRACPFLPPNSKQGPVDWGQGRRKKNEILIDNNNNVGVKLKH